MKLLGSFYTYSLLVLHHYQQKEFVSGSLVIQIVNS